MSEKVLPIEIPTYDYEKSPPIGIDLGTSNSAIAKWVNTLKVMGSQVYNLNDQDGHIMPSIVYLQEMDGQKDFLVGKEAYRRKISEPENVAFAIKRRIGDPSGTIRLGNDFYSPIELSAEIIKALFKSVISTGLRNPAGIVVSVPYYFTQNQNHHTKLAVEKAIAELDKFAELPFEDRPKLLGLIPEPVAAALSYASDDMDIPIDQVILTFDLGGGTLDLTIFKLRITGTAIRFEVLATDGNPRFGGEDFDQILEDYVVEQENISYQGLRPKLEKRQKLMVREAVKEAKERISEKKQMNLLIPNLPCGISVDAMIKRAEFEELLVGRNSIRRNFCAEFQEIIDGLLKKAKLSASAISTIFSIGGSTRIPFFRQLLENRFPNAHFPKLRDDEQDTLYLSVAKGAAMYAAYLLDKNDENYYLPFDKGIKFITRTSHNLGIRKYNDEFSILVPENKIVPITYDKTFVPTTYADQTKTLVHVPEIEIYQGRKEWATENTPIGTIRLPKIYADGRKLDDIKVHISFKVDVTTLDVSIHIPGSDENRQDIKLFKSIHLEEKD